MKGVDPLKKRIICLLLVAMLMALPMSSYTKSVHGNAGPVVIHEAASFTMLPEEDSPVEVEQETLVFDLREHNAFTAEVSVTYQMYYGGQDVYRQKLFFPVMNYYQQDLTHLADIFLDGGMVEFEYIELGQLPSELKDGPTDSYHEFVREISDMDFPQILERWQTNSLAEESRTSLAGLLFEVEFQPGSRREITVRYPAIAGRDQEETTRYQAVYAYILSPAALWKDFSNLTIEVYPHPDQPYMVNSTLPMEKVETDIAYDTHYSAFFSDLPEGDLIFQMYHRETPEPWLMATIQNPYLMGLVIVPLFLLILLTTITAIIIYAIRKKKKADHS